MYIDSRLCGNDESLTMHPQKNTIIYIMDPHTHQLSTMDPKLKAAYESVMKGPAPTASTPSEEKPKIPTPGLGSESAAPTTTSTTITTTTTAPPKMVVEEQKDPEPQPIVQPAAPQPTVLVKPATGGTVHIGYSAKPGAGHKLAIEKKSSGIPPALYIVGCILFFLLYSLFWVKVFGVKVPFLP